MEGDHWQPEPAEQQDSAGQHRARIKKPRRTVVIEPLLIIYALSGFPLMLLNQQYVYQQMARQVARDHGIVNYTVPSTSRDPCQEGGGNDTLPLANYTEDIQERSSNFQMYSNVASSIPSMFVTLFLGAYSDKAGRRYAILPPLVSAFCRSVVYVLVCLLDLSVYYLLLASLVEGLGGGYQTLFLGCFAYIADVTVSEKRAFRIVIAEFCMFLSLVLTPLGVGIWIQQSGYAWPVVCVLVGQSIALLYGIFFVPETIIPDPDARFFTSAHLVDTITLYTKDNATKRRWKLNILVAAFFVFALISLSSISIGSLFQMNHPLCWGSQMIGIYTAVYIAVASLGGIAFSKLLKLWISDDGTCLAAGIAATMGYTYLGFVRNSYMMIAGEKCVIYAVDQCHKHDYHRCDGRWFVTLLCILIILFPSVPLFFCVGMLLTPTLRAVMSKMVLPTEQGALFGSIALLEVLCSLVGSIILTQVYVKTIRIYTGFVYWVMALFTATGSSLIGTVVLLSRRQRPSYGPLLEPTRDVDVSGEDTGPET